MHVCVCSPSELKSAIECYSRCMELNPQQSVCYTNWTLCYIRINIPKKAEQDCTKALSLEKDNVKALFRRAEAKKSHHGKGIISHDFMRCVQVLYIYMFEFV